MLARWLGAQLLSLAAEAHGWPESAEFRTFEDWVHALRTNGEALLAYAADDADGQVAVTADAKAALRWVADHLEHLWD